MKFSSYFHLIIFNFIYNLTIPLSNLDASTYSLISVININFYTGRESHNDA